MPKARAEAAARIQALAAHPERPGAAPVLRKPPFKIGKAPQIRICEAFAAQATFVFHSH
jgi:hypothetical protein